MYSPQVLDHFQHPRNPGEIADPDASVQLDNPACGDVLKLTLRVVDSRIEDIRFLAQGCVPTMACASLLTDVVKGKTIAEARQLRREELVKAIGGLPRASIHASHLAIDALNAAIKKL
jgi:nitrogen fixation NifU-like protein